MSGGPRRERTVRTSVLVLNWNGRQHLDACLESLGALDVFAPGEPGRPREAGPVDEVVLVDNGSTDGSVARARDRFPWVRVLENGANLGFAAGYDAAVPLVDGEWVALLNSDTRVLPGWLSALHAAAARHPASGAVASRVLSWDGARVDFVGADTFFTGHAWQRGLGTPAGEGEPPERELLFGCAAALLVRREAFLRHGGFDPDYFAFFEDVDLGWRMALAGEATWLAPDAVVRHKLHGTFGSRPRARVRFLCERNALATAFKNFGEERAGVLLLAAAALTFLRGWASSASSRPAERPWLTTDALAHLLALADLARLAPALAERRAAAQAARTRSDADLAPLFGDFARPPTALGPEYRGPLEAVVATLGLADEGPSRVYDAHLCAAAREAALALFAACAEALGGRFEATVFVARAGDLDWEHPVGKEAAARFRATEALARELLLSRFDREAVDAFSRGLAALAAPRREPAPRPTAVSPPEEARPVAVSVVVRTKDRPKELAAALASLAAQTFRDFEVVLVDDGAGDAAPPTGGASLPIRVVRTGGVGRARAAQAGLEAAAGELVNYLDDDDTLLPDHLERLVATQRETGARVVHSVAMQVASAADGAGGARTVELGPIGGPLDPSRLFFESTLPLMTVLLDRELALEAGGFDPSLDYFEDWDLFLRLSRRAAFAHCPHVTALYRVEPGAGHGTGVAGAHRWPFLAELFERHRDRIAGADWARFYRDQVEGTRLRLAAAEAERAGAASRLARLEAEAGALSERARAAAEERDRVVAILRSVERSLGYRAGLLLRRLLGRA